MDETFDTTEPVGKQLTAEEICGSTNILDTVHLKNLVEDLAKLYGTSVCTKVPKIPRLQRKKGLQKQFAPTLTVITVKKINLHK